MTCIQIPRAPNFIRSTCAAVSTKPLNNLHHYYTSRHITQKLALQHPDIPGSIPTSIRFDLGGYRTSIRSCNHCGAIHFKEIRFQI